MGKLSPNAVNAPMVPAEVQVCEGSGSRMENVGGILRIHQILCCHQ